MRNRRRPAAAVFAAIAAGLLLAACGEETPQVSTEPGNAGQGSAADLEPDKAGSTSAQGGAGAAGAGAASSAEDLIATCGSVRFDELPADPSSFPPLGDLETEIDLTSIEGEQEIFEEHDWYLAEKSTEKLTLFGVPLESRPEASSYGFATFERQGDAWIPDGWGGCRIEVNAEGWGNARFVLDPDVEPDPAASTISVRAWEVECANGKAPEGREVRPIVVSEDADTVSVLVLVEPVEGGAECPSNPDFPLGVELAEPLGDRAVLDASVDPAFERPWPPTESSLSEQGREE